MNTTEASPTVATNAEPARLWRNWYVAHAAMNVTWSDGAIMQLAEGQLFSSGTYPSREIAEQKAMEDVGFNSSELLTYVGAFPDGEVPPLPLKEDGK